MMAAMAAPASHLLRGAVLGTALGLALAALYVGLDPNLRPLFGPSLARSAPRMMAASGACGLLVAGLASLLSGAGWRRWARFASGALLPAAGLGSSVLASPATPWTLTPRETGLIVTTSDAAFLAVSGVAALALAAPLGRWAAAAPRSLRAGLGGAMAGLACLGLLLFPARSAGPQRAGGPEADAALRPVRVVLVGIDGADWREIRPLVARGELPAFAELLETGASGDLSTFRPTLSPMIWTTVATGQPPLRHGIVDFVHAETGIPFTSNARRVPALWNILGERGISVAVVGWWVTWPAEPVNGRLVSSYSPDFRIKGTLFEGLDRQTHPPGLMDELRPLIEPALARGREEFQETIQYYRPPADDAAFGERVRRGAWVLGADRLFAESAARIAEGFAPRFLVTYLASPDNNGHVFCHANPWRAETCGRVMAGAYAAVDRHLGRILEAMGDDATLVLVSDHGFDRETGHEGGPVQGTPGIVILRGDGIRAGATIRGASVYDVAPTILALFGLPIPDDLRGRVLLSAFEPEAVERLGLRFGPRLPERYPRGHPALRPIPSPTDDLLVERLRALGYLR